MKYKLRIDADARAEPDAAPCDVIVADRVFRVQRCEKDALHTISWLGERWRVCQEHLSSVGLEPQ